MKKKAHIRIKTILIIVAIILLLVLGSVLIWKFVITPSNSETKDVEDTPVVVEQEEATVIPVATKDELLAEVNKRRAEVGVAPLQHSPELEATAQAKCDDMVARNYYDHVNPDGIRGVKVAELETGWYGWFGENLLMQSVPDDSAKNVFDTWVRSEGHKEQLLDPIYTLTGFGICGDTTPNSYSNPTYFVEHFYGPE